ncbi:PREDICTED: dystonin-like, partial [Priapulus caudatus]|uniref:Dystonin-like n=1 Tax=Priapulus caudatus TaxID=37621 RepID=A0ABM1F8R3_PRICU
MSVLGPIATEPGMLNNQTQQVKVLQDDFKDWDAQLQQLNESGETVLDKLQAGSPEALLIADQMAAINQHWDDVQGRLDERDQLLDGALVASTDFHESVSALHDWLNAVEVRLEEGEATDDTAQQLAMLKDFVGARLLSGHLSGQRARQRLRTSAAAAKKPFKDCTERFYKRKQELSSVVKAGEHFDELCSQMELWLADSDRRLGDDFQLSGRAEKLSEQLADHVPLHREISSRENEIQALLVKGQLMADQASPTVKEHVEDKINDLRSHWDDVLARSGQRRDKLQQATTQSGKFALAVELLLPWLARSEKRLRELQTTSLTRADAQKQLQETQAFHKEVMKKTKEFDNVVSLGSGFLAMCDCD